MAESSRVWSKFSATNSAGTVVNLRIVEVPKGRYGGVVELFMNHFVTEESTFRASERIQAMQLGNNCKPIIFIAKVFSPIFSSIHGVPKSAEAMEEMRESLWQRENDASFHKVICCLDNDDDEVYDIIGASMMMLTTPEERLQKKVQRKTETLAKLYAIFEDVMSLYDEAKELNMHRYFMDRGVVVHPDFRGLGIAQEFFKVRRMICKEYGVLIHGGWMTSYGTQKAAERDGWKIVCEVHYDELGKKHGVTFENGPPTCKFMIARIS